MISVLAVYENGVLRPKEPLKLAEGATVQLAVYPQITNLSPRAPTPEEQAYIDRLSAAKTLEEMFAVMDSAPPFPDEDYDLCQALNANRKASGERPLFPELEDEAQS